MEDGAESSIVHRSLDTDDEDPSVQLAEIVAELEEKEPNELSTMYGCVDGVLDHLFSNPPSAEAQMQVTFTFEGYRVTIEQNGTAKFVKAG